MAALEHLLGSERSIVAEVLVVDDGSDDDTVDSVCRRFPGVRLIAHTSNRRFGAAVNTGFSAARGQYLAARAVSTTLRQPDSAFTVATPCWRRA